MRGAIALGALMLCGVGLLGGCGSDDSSEFPDGGPNNGKDGGASCEPFCTPDIDGATNDGGLPGPCVNLQCKQVTCPNSGTTSISGKITVDVGKDAALTIGGKQTVAVSKEASLSAKKIQLTADDEISFVTGSASFTLKKNGDITIKGKKITVQGSGDVVIKGSKVTQN